MLTAPPSLADFAGLSGSALIAVVYSLLVVEEVGIPLFLAPGDQLLVVSGAAVPAAHLNPPGRARAGHGPVRGRLLGPRRVAWTGRLDDRPGLLAECGRRVRAVERRCRRAAGRTVARPPVAPWRHVDDIPKEASRCSQPRDT